MVSRTIRIDDIDGTSANSTIAFSIDGKSYSIDLSEENEKKFRAALEPYIRAAESIRKERRTKVVTETTGIDQRMAIREWAKTQGLSVSQRGRIAQDIVDQFHLHHG